MNVEEAKKIVMEEEQKRQEVCIAEVDAVLKKHGYRLQITSNYILVPNQQVANDGVSVPR